MRLVPWAFCLATAIWFGWQARRAGRNWELWAFGGGGFALVVSTIVIGLAHAGIIPISHAEHVRLDFGSAALAAILVLALGWGFTANLHGQHRPLLARIRALLKKQP